MPENAGFIKQKTNFCRNFEQNKILGIINNQYRKPIPATVLQEIPPINRNKITCKLVEIKKNSSYFCERGRVIEVADNR